jgi:hypothetical protein
MAPSSDSHQPGGENEIQFHESTAASTMFVCVPCCVLLRLLVNDTAKKKKNFFFSTKFSLILFTFRGFSRFELRAKFLARMLNENFSQLSNNKIK